MSTLTGLEGTGGGFLLLWESWLSWLELSAELLDSVLLRRSPLLLFVKAELDLGGGGGAGFTPGFAAASDPVTPFCRCLSSVISDEDGLAFRPPEFPL